MKRDRKSDHVTRGRPRVYSDDDIAVLLDRMGSEGKTLLALCRDTGVAYSTARKRVNESAELSALYSAAREEYAHTRVQQMDDIIASACDSLELQRAKLHVDVVKWQVARVLPKVYGERVQHEMGGSVEVVRRLTDDDLEARINHLLAMTGYAFKC